MKYVQPIFWLSLIVVGSLILRPIDLRVVLGVCLCLAGVLGLFSKIEDSIKE